MTETNWGKLIEEHEVTYLKADICLGSPESYSLDEKRRICEEMEASTAEVDAAMRADFESLPDESRSRTCSYSRATRWAGPALSLAIEAQDQEATLRQQAWAGH